MPGTGAGGRPPKDEPRAVFIVKGVPLSVIRRFRQLAKVTGRSQGRLITQGIRYLCRLALNEWPATALDPDTPAMEDPPLYRVVSPSAAPPASLPLSEPLGNQGDGRTGKVAEGMPLRPAPAESPDLPTSPTNRTVLRDSS